MKAEEKETVSEFSSEYQYEMAAQAQLSVYQFQGAPTSMKSTRPLAVLAIKHII